MVAAFESYLPTVNTTLNETVSSEDEFKEAFKSLKRNNATDHDGLDANIITSVYEKKPLLKIFNESINLGIFPKKMKISKVTSIFKSGKKELLTNYWSIFALSCFSCLISTVAYCRVYNYLNDNNYILLITLLLSLLIAYMIPLMKINIHEEFSQIYQKLLITLIIIF